jgi:PII-like signaling protein
MQSNQGMKQVQIFIDVEDVWEGEALSENILRYLLHHEIRGATMFKGMVGFGARHHLHHPERVAASDSQPVMITFIDVDAHVDAVLPYLKSVVRQGIILQHQVEVV